MIFRVCSNPNHSMTFIRAEILDPDRLAPLYKVRSIMFDYIPILKKLLGVNGSRIKDKAIMMKSVAQFC